MYIMLYQLTVWSSDPKTEMTCMCKCFIVSIFTWLDHETIWITLGIYNYKYLLWVRRDKLQETVLLNDSADTAHVGPLYCSYPHGSYSKGNCHCSMLTGSYSSRELYCSMLMASYSNQVNFVVAHAHGSLLKT